MNASSWAILFCFSVCAPSLFLFIAGCRIIFPRMVTACITSVTVGMLLAMQTGESLKGAVLWFLHLFSFLLFLFCCSNVLLFIHSDDETLLLSNRNTALIVSELNSCLIGCLPKQTKIRKTTDRQDEHIALCIGCRCDSRCRYPSCLCASYTRKSCTTPWTIRSLRANWSSLLHHTNLYDRASHYSRNVLRAGRWSDHWDLSR